MPAAALRRAGAGGGGGAAAAALLAALLAAVGVPGPGAAAGGDERRSRGGGAGEWHRYCIIGGGPAGLQLGHFFKHANRDYVIYERNDRAGSFFAKYPRHRMLISLNKRVVREGRSEEFAFRHDWNSLIDVRPHGNRTAPVTQRTKLLFPHADTLEEYLNDFAEEQSGHIRYGVQVVHVHRKEAGGGADGGGADGAHAGDGEGGKEGGRAGRGGFDVVLAYGAGSGGGGGLAEEAETWVEKCGEVIVATGLWRPRGVKVRVDGAKYVEGYEDVPSSGEAYEGKSVLVMGMGNAAMETVQELQKYTSEMHLYGRQRPLPQGGVGVRFAYQTHYVGDIRAGRVTMLDTYLLKSLDSFDFNALDGITRLLILPCVGRLCIWQMEANDCANQHCKGEFGRGGQDLDYHVPIGSWVKGSHAGDLARELFAEYPKREGEHNMWDISEESQLGEEADSDAQGLESLAERASRRSSLGINDTVFNTTMESLRVSSKLLREQPELMDALVPVMVLGSGSNTRYPVDHVIRCFGWAMDTAIFHPSINLTTSHKGKYPVIEPNFEAKGAPGIHVAGTLGHSLDFRRSAGGFIHGFRYTARALFRRLEEKNHGVAWPQSLVSLRVNDDGSSPGIDQLVGLFHKRINEASGPYQMFETLGDMVVFEEDANTGDWQARYFEEVPLEYWDERYNRHPRLTWVFKYNDKFYGPKVLGEGRVGSTSPYTAENSNFLHPHLYFKEPGNATASLRHWMTEDIFTQWTNAPTFAPLARFVAHVVATLTGSPEHEREGAFSLEQPRDTLEAIKKRYSGHLKRRPMAAGGHFAAASLVRKESM